MAHFLLRNGAVQGPWKLEDIVEGLSTGQFAATDHVYIEETETWAPLMDWQPAREQLKKKIANQKMPKIDMANITPPTKETVVATPKPTKKATTSAPSMETANFDVPEWVAMTSMKQEVAGLSTREVIQMLQSKELQEFDMIRRSDITDWKRIAEHPYFSRDAIKKLISTDPKKWPFAKRKFPRIPFKTDVFVHDTQRVFQGQSYEGGEGGSGLVIMNSVLMPGDQILIHFMGAPSAGIPAFNAECEIVSKSFVPGLRDARSPVQYGVRFLKIDSRVEKEVSKFFKTKGAQWTHS